MNVKTPGEYGHAQSTTFGSLTVNMTQQIEMRAIGKAIEVTRGLLLLLLELKETVSLRIQKGQVSDRK